MAGEWDPRAPLEGDDAPFEDFPEDPLLEASLRNLATISAPPTFLSSVMYRVHEKHARDHLKWPQVLGLSLLLILASALFFVQDVLQYRHEHQLPNFATALQLRFQELSESVQHLVNHGTDLIAASWQVLNSLTHAFFTNTPASLQVVLVLVVVGFFWLARRWLKR